MSELDETKVWIDKFMEHIEKEKSCPECWSINTNQAAYAHYNMGHKPHIHIRTYECKDCGHTFNSKDWWNNK